MGAHLMAASKSSKESGTVAPASRRAAFFPWADSISLPLRAPAWPNCTSDLNSVAQVPLTQATTGLVIAPALIAYVTEFKRQRACMVVKIVHQDQVKHNQHNQSPIIQHYLLYSFKIPG